MEVSAGDIFLNLQINPSQLTNQLTGAAQNASKQATNIFSGLGKKIGGLLGTAAVVKFTKDCLDMGSSLAEVQNVVDTAFGSMAGSANDFAKSAMENFGMSELSAKKYMGVFGQMSSAMGITGEAALDMAENVTALTGDVASFYNLGMDEAYTKLKSIWTGETETLKDLGVVMTQTNLDQYALNNGFGKTTAKMTEQEKVMLRYQYVTSALSNASGDFLKTQDSWANQTRVLTLRFQQLQATLGKGFIVLFTPIVKGINSCLIGLQKLADGFTDLILMLTGADISSSTGSIATDMSGIGDSATDVADSVSGIGSAAADTAKKIKGSLSGLDELNNLSIDDSDSGSSGGGISAGMAGVSSTATSMVDEVEKVSDSLARFKQIAEELKDIFKTGFKDGLGKDFTASLQRQKKHLLSIKNSITDIFTDPEVTAAAYNYSKSVSKALGTVSGSVTSIGATICENLLGGFDRYLSKNRGFIKERLANIFTATAENLDLTSQWYATLADIAEVFRSDTAKGITSDIISIFSNGFLETVELSERFTGDIAALIIEPVSENVGKIKLAFENTLESVNPVLDKISTDYTKLCTKMSTVYDEHIKPMFAAFTDGLTSITSTLLDGYNTYIAPTLDKISQKAEVAWDEHIKPVFDKCIEITGKAADALNAFWTNIVEPFVNWIASNIIPMVAPVIEEIASNFIQRISDTMDIIRDMQTLLGDFLDFIKYVFEGDWENAWRSVVNSFESIFSLVYDIAKKPINMVIGLVNGMLTGIQAAINGIVKNVNKLSFTTPDWVPGIGGKSFGFDLPRVELSKIPYLAQGGYVKANTPQLAMIGDNRHQGEVVAPEDKLKQMAAEAARMSNGNTSQEAIELLSRIIRLLESRDKGDIIIQMDGKEIFKVTRKQAREYFDRTGNPAFDF